MNIIPDFYTDSENYEVLIDSAKLVKDVEGMVCEIGLRLGGGMFHLMESFCSMKQEADRLFVSIDPYGNIDYADTDTSTVKFDYTNQMKNECLANMYLYCLQRNLNYTFYNLEDTEFFVKYADGIPVYQDIKTIQVDYALVHLDGPHTKSAVMNEINFFEQRMSKGGIIICDDVNNYDHTSVDKYLISEGWQIVINTPRKVAYQYDRR